MQRFSAEWSKAQIDGAAPAQYRAQREGFYRDLGRRLPQHVLDLVLAALVFAPKVAAWRSAERTRGRTAADGWYWSERQQIETALDWLRGHPLVRPASNFEVLFYEPGEVDCHHGRRRKMCVCIRAKLEQRTNLQEARQSLLGRRTADPLLRSWQRRITELDIEIQELDARVKPATADPNLFCARADPIDLSLVQEEEARRPAKGKPGAPVDDVQNYLLETAGAALVNAGHTRHDACEVIASALIYCSPDGAERVADLPQEDAIADLCDNLERQWRKLRARNVVASSEQSE